MKHRSKLNTSMKGRVLALALAVTTFLTSWSVDWNMLHVKAATGDTLTNSDEYVSSGGAIAQQITNSLSGTGNLLPIDSISVKVDLSAGETVTGAISIYRNTTDIYNLGSAVQTWSQQTATSATASSAVLTFTPSSVSNGVYLSDGESAIAIVTLTSNINSTVTYYTASSGSSWYKTSSASAFSGGSSNCMEYTTGAAVASSSTDYNAAVGVSSISVDQSSVVVVTGKSVEITPTISPALLRSYTVSGNDAAVATVANTTGGTIKITGQTAGTTSFTLSCGSASTTVNVIVLEVVQNASSYTYTGATLVPDITVYAGASQTSPLTAGTDYQVSVSNNQKDVGTATVTLSASTGTYAGFSWSGDNFTISKASLSTDATLNAAVQAGNYTIDTATNSLTAGSFTGLNNETLSYANGDFTVSLLVKDIASTSVTYELTVTGQGNYTGSVTFDKVVSGSSTTQLDISGIARIANIGAQDYTGDPVEPAISFVKSTDETTPLALDSNYYTVSYTNNTACGTATVTVTGNGIYTGTLTKTFKISQVSLDASNTNITVAAIANQNYTGSALTPTPAITRSLTTGTRTLTLNTDYTLTYSNNTNVGEATITITGTGNYRGSRSVNFSIVGQMNNAEITIENAYTATAGGSTDYEVIYDGNAYEPMVSSVTVGGVTLSSSTDYSVSYEDNINASTQAAVVITGSGKYANQTAKIYFTINPRSIANSTLSCSPNTLTYANGAEVKPDSTTLTLTYGGSVHNLTYASTDTNPDYTVEYSDTVNAGSVSAVVTGIGNYTGTRTVNQAYVISPLNVSALDVSVASASYTGSSVTPEVTVTYGGNPVSSDYYSLSYSNNVAVGDSARVTIAGSGNLTGSRTETFSISQRSLLSNASFTIGGKSYGTVTSSATPVSVSDPYSVEFTGKVQKPSVSVVDDGSALVNGSDYTVSYDNNKVVGTTAQVIVTGAGNYAGDAITFYFTISQKSLGTDLSYGTGISVDTSDVINSGIVVKDSNRTSAEQTLVEGTDYSVVYGGGANAATYHSTAGAKTATITGLGNYTGSIIVNYSIGTDIADSNSGFYFYYKYGSFSTQYGTWTPHKGSAKVSDANAHFTTPYLGERARPYLVVGTSTDGGTTVTPISESLYSFSYNTTSRSAGTTVTATLVLTSAGAANYYASETLSISYDILAVDTSTMSDYTKMLFFEPTDDPKEVDTTQNSTTGRTSYSYTGSAITPYSSLRYNVRKYTTLPGYTEYSDMIVFEDQAVNTNYGYVDLTMGSDYTVATSIGPEVSASWTEVSIVMQNANFTGPMTKYAKVVATNADDVTIVSTSKAAINRASIEYDTSVPEYPNAYTVDYTGSSVTPFGNDLNLYYKNKKLALSSDNLASGDYMVTYYDGTTTTATITPANVTSLSTGTPLASGTWYAVITMSANFGSDVIYGSFEVSKQSISTGSIAVYNTTDDAYTDSAFRNYSYTGDPQYPGDGNDVNKFAVRDSSGKWLTKDSDYTVSIANTEYGDSSYRLPGLYTVTVTGIGNYQGSLSLTYKVIGDISDTTLFSFFESDPIVANGNTSAIAGNRYIITKSGSTYTNSEFKKNKFYMTYGGVDAATASTTLPYKFDSSNGTFTIGDSGITTPGKVTITFTGSGDYFTGSRSYTVKAIGKASDITITGLSENYAYVPGSTTEPAAADGLVASYNGKVLTPNTDFAYGYLYSNQLSTSQKAVVYVNCDGSGLSGYYTGSTATTSTYQYNILYDLSKVTIANIPDKEYSGSAYLGSNLVPSVLYNLGTKPTLTYGNEYTVTPTEGFTDVGTHSFTIAAVAGYSYNSASTSFKILGLDIADGDMVINPSSFTYSGEENKPSVTVTYGTNTLTAGSDYVVSYKNNTNAYTYTSSEASFDATKAPAVTITGKGNYSGTVTKYFTIQPKNIGPGGTASGKIELTNTTVEYAGGTDVTPSYTVYDGTTQLSADSYTVDTVTYVRNVGQTGTVQVTCKGNYAGTLVSDTYTVVAASLNSATINIDVSSREYTGGAVEPVITAKVTNGSSTKTLVKGDTNTGDYYVSYSGAKVTAAGEMIEVGTYTVTLTGRGNYTDTYTTTFEITKKELDWYNSSVAWSVAGDGDDWYYNTSGDVVESKDVYEVTVPDKDYNDGSDVTFTNSEFNLMILDKRSQTDSGLGDYYLQYGTDFTVTYANNKNAAASTDTIAPTLTFTGIGNYGGTLTATFNIGKNIADPKYSASLSRSTYTYNGTSQIPTVTVTDSTGAATFVEGTDFTVSTPTDSINAQNGIELYVTGCGQYYGTMDAVTYDILPKTIDASNASKIVIKPTNLTKTYDTAGTTYSYFTYDSDKDEYYYWSSIYNGSAIKATFEVYDTEISSTSTIDADFSDGTASNSTCSIAYSNNTNAGGVTSPAVASVTLGGNYNAYTLPDFKYVILPYNGGVKLTLSTNEMAYTGKNLTPSFTVTTADGSKTLTRNTDYTLTYSNNKNVGDATVTVTGINNYVGNNTSGSFVIYANLTTSCVTIPDQLYTGSSIKPNMTVTCGGNTLVEGTDYQVTTIGSDNNYTSSGYVIIDSLKPTYYRNTPITKSYNIVFGADYVTVYGIADQYTYTGSAIKPTPTLQDTNGNTLSASISYSNSSDGSSCINVGTVTYTATVTINGNSLKKTGTYDIIQRDINSCEIGSVANDNYTGAALTPPVSVTYLGRSLGIGSEYNISYANNVNPGTASITLAGVGNFTGSRVMYFTIATPNVRTVEAEGTSKSEVAVTWGKANHVTGYEITYSDGKKTYTKDVSDDNTYTISGLSQASSVPIGIRAYVNISGQKYYSTTISTTGKTLVSTPSFKVKSKKANQAKLSWKKNSSASGYMVYRSTKKNKGFKKVANVPGGKSSWTNKKLKSGKKYYYYIVAYQIIDGKYVYGAKSKVKSVKVK